MAEQTTNSQIVLSVRIKNDKTGPQTGDVVLNGSILNEYGSNEEYDIGDVVAYDGKLWQSLVKQVSGATFERIYWKQIGIPDTIFPDWKPNTFYYEGQAIVFEGKIFRAISEHTSTNRFDLAKWDAPLGSYKDLEDLPEIDDEILDKSKNAVENRAIAKALEKKLDKVTATSTEKRAYIAAEDGTQTVIELRKEATPETIALRDENGCITASDPQNANQVVTKRFLRNTLLDSVYPVGSIYMSTKNTDPGTFLGGTWTEFAPAKVTIGTDLTLDAYSWHRTA